MTRLMHAFPIHLVDLALILLTVTAGAAMVAEHLHLLAYVHLVTLLTIVVAGVVMVVHVHLVWSWYAQLECQAASCGCHDASPCLSLRGKD